MSTNQCILATLTSVTKIVILCLCSERPSARSALAPAAYQPAPVQTQTLDKYKNAKSISSDNFFGGEAVQADSSHLARFQGSQSISSDAFYGNNTRGRSASGECTFVRNVGTDSQGFDCLTLVSCV